MTGAPDCWQCCRIADGLALGNVAHQLAVHESLLLSQHPAEVQRV